MKYFESVKFNSHSPYKQVLYSCIPFTKQTFKNNLSKWKFVSPSQKIRIRVFKLTERFQNNTFVCMYERHRENPWQTDRGGRENKITEKPNARTIKFITLDTYILDRKYSFFLESFRFSRKFLKKCCRFCV